MNGDSLGWLGAVGAFFFLALRINAKQEARYQWGEADAEGISLGLLVEKRVVRPGQTIKWQIAIRNRSSRQRTLIVANDLDSRPRYRLSVAPASGGGKPDDFPPAERGPVTTSNISRTVSVPAGGIAELEPESAPLGARLGAGNYRAKAVYGGEGFSFRFESGAVEIAIE